VCHVGFLGLLHADVVRERLEREFDLSIVLTPPQVEFIKEGEGMYKEPIVKIMIITPSEYVGGVMELCEHYRGKFQTMDNKHQVNIIYHMPLSEMISDFFDRLKSVTSGYASLDWELIDYAVVKADKLLLLLNSDPVEEFSEVVVAERAFEKADNLCKKLRDLIPRQQYEVKIQGQCKVDIIFIISLIFSVARMSLCGLLMLSESISSKNSFSYFCVNEVSDSPASLLPRMVLSSTSVMFIAWSTW
jgi:GTP-binding protein LepA